MKKIMCGLLVIVVGLCLTACGSRSNGPFTITCTGENLEGSGMSQTSKSIYEFDKDQYITNYEITTVTKYDTAETYKFYKESSETTANTNTSSQITYTVEGDDENNTLTFAYKVTISSEDLANSDDKDFYKAVNVLKRAETSNSKCTIKGINKNKIK